MCSPCSRIQGFHLCRPGSSRIVRCGPANDSAVYDFLAEAIPQAVNRPDRVKVCPLACRQPSRRQDGAHRFGDALQVRGGHLQQPKRSCAPQLRCPAVHASRSSRRWIEASWVCSHWTTPADGLRHQQGYPPRDPSPTNSTGSNHYVEIEPRGSDHPHQGGVPYRALHHLIPCAPRPASSPSEE